MTLKEFSIKHDIPYTIIYTASYRVKPKATLIRDKDFPEDELADAVTEMLKKRIGYHHWMMSRDREMLRKLEVPE